MIIKKINIKNFGKLSDITITPNKGINVIYGPNEAGKTTLLSFIRYIFYGTKHKKGYKDLTFKERYMPWNAQPIAGSCEVEHKGYIHSIQRSDGDGLGDLSVINLKTGNIEKHITNPGESFLSVGEKTFYDSFFINDLSAISEFSDSGELVSFLTDSSNENSTYQNVKAELTERLAQIVSPKRKASTLSVIKSQLSNYEDELRTLNMQTHVLQNKIKDIPEIEEDIDKLTSEIDDLTKEKSKKIKIEIKREIECLNQEKTIIQNELDGITSARILTDEEKTVLIDDFSEYTQSVSKQTFLRNLHLGLSCVFFVICLLASVLSIYKSLYFSPVLIASLLLTVYFTFKTNKLNKLLKNTKNKYNDEKFNQQELRRELGLNTLSDCLIYISSLAKEVSSSQHNYLINRLNDINSRLNQYNILIDGSQENGLSDTNFFTNSNLDDIIKEKQKEKDELLSELNRLLHYKNEYDALNIEIQSIKNECNRLNTEIDFAKKDASVIECSLEILERAFEKTKESFFPELARQTLEIFNFVVNGNYDSVNFDEKFDIMFNKDGFFKNSRFLSSGTFDALYLSLRFAIINVICANQPGVPVFIDDIFANCDDSRAERLMDIIYKISSEHQVFICTCRNRDVEFLKNKNNVNIINIQKG